MIPHHPNLFRDPGESRRLMDTVPGQAFFGGTGPAGMTCGSCGFWQLEEEKKGRRCHQFRRLTGRMTRRIVWFERTDGEREAPKENHGWFIWQRTALQVRAAPVTLYGPAAQPQPQPSPRPQPSRSHSRPARASAAMSTTIKEVACCASSTASCRAR
jgi:hypothetical protein